MQVARRALPPAKAAPTIGPVGHWSNPATWGGTKPTAGAAVTISAGNTVVLDENTPSLGALTISGTLRVKAGAKVDLTCDNILVTSTGRLECGTVGAPFTGRCTITLTGAEQSRVARFVADTKTFAGTYQRTGSGTGKLTQLIAVTGAVAETITVTFTSAAAFNVSGSVSGSLGSGTVGAWFSNKVEFLAVAGATPWASGDTNTITVTAGFGFTNNGVGRSLIVDPGGALELVGVYPAVPWTRLNDHITAGTATASLRATTGWGPRDRIAISATDFRDTARGVAALNYIKRIGASADLTGSVATDRWGKIQYATDSGMSLTPGTLTRPSNASDPASYISVEDWDLIPKTLDQAAFVGNLTRNIVIQGADDSAWQTSGFGAHTMVMGLASTYILIGVELRRMGQAGALGRYATHFHMLSWGGQKDGNLNKPAGPTFLGAVDPLRFRVEYCAIHKSTQRGTVIHGTWGASVKNNVYYDIRGHVIFLEDGSEEQNTITGNLVMEWASVSTPNRLISSDGNASEFGGGASGIWFQNCNNTITDNVCVGGQTGLWDASASVDPNGLSRDVGIDTNTRPVLAFDRNIAACTAAHGFDRESTVPSHTHSLMVNHFRGQRWVITGNTVYKTRFGGYRNRIMADPANPTLSMYRSWTAADVERCQFSGATINFVPFKSALMVGTSLNNPDAARYASTRASGFQSYDQGFEANACIAMNWPLVLGPGNDTNAYGAISPGQQHAGFIRFGEYTPNMWAFEYFNGFKKAGTTTVLGGVAIAPNIDNVTYSYNGTTGPCRDVNNLFGHGANRTVYFDVPFMTWNASDVQAVHAGCALPSATPGVVSTATKGYGVRAKRDGATDVYRDGRPIRYTRINPGTMLSEGSWELATTASEPMGLSHFRQACFLKGGVYKIDWYGSLPTTWANVGVALAREADDEFTVGVAWNGSVPITSVSLRAFDTTDGASGTDANNRMLNSTGMTSAADVIADTTGTKFWLDTANNVVWVKYKGGLTNVDTAAAGGAWANDRINKTTGWSIVIRA